MPQTRQAIANTSESAHDPEQHRHIISEPSRSPEQVSAELRRIAATTKAGRKYVQENSPIEILNFLLYEASVGPESSRLVEKFMQTSPFQGMVRRHRLTRGMPPHNTLKQIWAIGRNWKKAEAESAEAILTGIRKKWANSGKNFKGPALHRQELTTKVLQEANFEQYFLTTTTLSKRLTQAAHRFDEMCARLQYTDIGTLPRREIFNILADEIRLDHIKMEERRREAGRKHALALNADSESVVANRQHASDTLKKLREDPEFFADDRRITDLGAAKTLIEETRTALAPTGKKFQDVRSLYDNVLASTAAENSSLAQFLSSNHPVLAKRARYEFLRFEKICAYMDVTVPARLWPSVYTLLAAEVMARDTRERLARRERLLSQRENPKFIAKLDTGLADHMTNASRYTDRKFKKEEPRADLASQATDLDVEFAELDQSSLEELALVAS